MRVGGIRLISLWPFQDRLFSRRATYLVVELNWDGQLVREVQRAAADGSSIHFWGRCGELPSSGELLEDVRKLLKNEPLKRDGWRTEKW
jgi:2-oxoglutarate/2-oxoacid ferredoxin oxidoreductase subunit alpha